MADKSVKRNSKDINILNPKQLEECIKWATTRPEKNKKTIDKSIRIQNEECTKKEREWGNEIIGQKNNGQWTTKLGESLVRSILYKKGENPRKPPIKGGYQPDLETDTTIYEVKTSNWWITGTAGEKVYGTWLKYQDIPDLYGKPLIIICVAEAEYDLEYGKLKIFGENVTPKTKEALDLAMSWGIKYMKFSDLISTG